MSALFPESRLTCERCSGHGYVPTGLGRLACLECSAAANSSWIPASKAPTSDVKDAGHSIDCLAVVEQYGERTIEIAAYWPARSRWTATRMDGMEPADVEVEVSHWMPSPELPA
jgi:hypothetical protein